MNTEAILFMQSEADGERDCALQIVQHCAPLLKGLRISSLLSIEKGKLPWVIRAIRETGIDYKVLAERREISLVFLYRRGKLQAYIKSDDVQQFLLSCGYGSLTIDALMYRISEKISSAYHKEKEFPHEVGIFLTYPIEDIKGFIRHKGQRYLMTGYWKVYHNPTQTRYLFYAYDKAKTSAINEILAGKTVREITQLGT